MKLSICVLLTLAYIYLIPEIHAEELFNGYSEPIIRSPAEQAIIDKEIDERANKAEKVFWILFLGAPACCFVIEFIKDYIIR